MNIPQNIGSNLDHDDRMDLAMPGTEGPAIDIGTILRFVRRRIVLIVSVCVVLTTIAAAVVYQLTPRYTATALLFLNPPKENVIDFEAVLSGIASDSASFVSEFEILKSRALAEKVIDHLNLMKDPEIAPIAENGIGARSWIQSLVSGQGAPDATVEAQRRMAAIDRLIAMESVKQKPGTRILEISITSVDPAKAAKIANELVDVYIASQIEAKFEATREANVWLAKRIDELGQQLQESERVVESYRAANGLQGSGGVTLNDQQLSELNAQLILARADAAAKQAKYDRARQILAGKGSIESVTDVLQSSTIAALRAKEAELAREQADLSTKYGPRHPSILNIEAQRRDTSRQISVEIQRIVGGISNEVAVADSRVKALQDSLNQLQDRAGANNQAAVKLRELERQAAANRTVYEAFLNRFKETGQQQGLQTADSRVIQQAIVPTGPSYPKTTKILLGAVAASLMVGLGIAILLELLDNGITTPMQVETALGLPLLVSVPLIPVEKGADGKLMGPTEYVVRKPLSAYSEAMRSMRSTLALSNVDSPPKVILFTSSLPEEGKTTTSASFAREAALSGKRVLLIDCDLRHPSVHKALLGNATPKFGLVELLAGSCKMEEAVMCDTESGLDFLPVVIGAVNPPDILGSAQMRSLVAKCRERYDLVIIDSPPVMPVVDSRVLGHVADKTVFVVRWQKTPLDAARIAIRELRHANVDVVGAVLSLVDTVSQAKYGYGASGYYYGRYTRYYSN